MMQDARDPYEERKIYQEEIKTLKEVLVEIRGHNRIKTDLEAYLFKLAGWAIGINKKKPNIKEYGC